MEQKELLQALLQAMNEFRAEVNEKLSGLDAKISGMETKIIGMDARVSGIEGGLKDLNQKVDRIERTVNGHTDILHSFKFDVDFLAEKQVKNAMKMNRIEKLLNY
ncbi:hypothetical protein D1B31_05005 [Neobacillus notoginsengisoli]|uniref:Uncharacterized protein n=1 Tax=Neobacillus notoginsengisoli TaxID=1578198 RepID=A0A417YX68_9BACI|nr:hypothetical protein [Neobacillus notoginsengisoli]RHW42005.1 hypothetical protein D1B31_05005 [Neobacillus notoginsengisoli]